MPKTTILSLLSLVLCIVPVEAKTYKFIDFESDRHVIGASPAKGGVDGVSHRGGTTVPEPIVIGDPAGGSRLFFGRQEGAVTEEIELIINNLRGDSFEQDAFLGTDLSIAALEQRAVLFGFSEWIGENRFHRVVVSPGGLFYLNVDNELKVIDTDFTTQHRHCRIELGYSKGEVTVFVNGVVKHTEPAKATSFAVTGAVMGLYPIGELLATRPSAVFVDHIVFSSPGTQPDMRVGRTVLDNNQSRKMVRTGSRLSQKWRFQSANTDKTMDDDYRITATGGSRQFQSQYFKLQGGVQNITADLITGNYIESTPAESRTSVIEMRSRPIRATTRNGGKRSYLLRVESTQGKPESHSSSAEAKHRFVKP